MMTTNRGGLNLLAILAAILLVVYPCCVINVLAASTTISCPDPLRAVLGMMSCMEDEDAECVADRISHSSFKKLHNGMETEVKILDGKDPMGHLETSFKFIRYAFDIEYQQELGPNLVGLGYVEMFTTSSGESFGLAPSNEYPFSQTILQHEMAAVSVNDACKITVWDQYGDDKEQQALDKVVSDMLQNPTIQCVTFNKNC
jgi:hypothetical protein